MDRTTLRKSAFAMPPTNPAFPPGPYRFVDREYFIIRYRTDPQARAAWCRSRSSSSSRW
jgi:acetoacetate decarboxylase